LSDSPIQSVVEVAHLEKFVRLARERRLPMPIRGIERNVAAKVRKHTDSFSQVSVPHALA
jgi:hypothetical protein